MVKEPKKESGFFFRFFLVNHKYNNHMNKKLIIVLAILCLVACEAVFVEDISIKYVTLVAPTDNVTVKEGSVNFLWEKIEAADLYQIQIATPSFNSASQVVLDTTIAKNAFTYKVTAGNYEWRVKAKNSGYETAYETYKLNVSDTDIANAETELVLPKADEITNTNSQKLTWTHVEDATEYRLQIWTPDLNGTLVKDISSTKTEYTHEFTDGKYIWQVRPQNDSQNGKFTSRKITVDTKKPSNPENKTPNNNTTQTASTINFTWTRTEVAGTSEVDSIYVYTDVNLTQLSFKAEGINKTYTKEDVEKNTYYWYVQAFDKANNQSEKSTTFSITIN